MTVQYKCNVCNRSIEVPENKRGLDVFGNCIITNQCKGTLFFVKNTPSILRNTAPEPSKLADWVYTPQIVTFTQNNARSIWKFKHTLTAVPSLSVHIWTVDSNNKTITVHLKENEYSYTFNNQYLELTFPSKFSGMVQCVVRNTTSILQPPKIHDQFVKVSTSGLVSLAIHSHNNLYVATDTGVHNNALSILLNEIQIDYDLGTNDPGQSWGNINQIYMYGNTYDISTFNILVDTPNDFIDSSSSVRNYSAYRYIGEDPMMYILMSNSNNYVDKIYNKIVNVFELNVNNNYIKNNELYISPSIIRECYPHIKLV